MKQNLLLRTWRTLDTVLVLQHCHLQYPQALQSRHSWWHEHGMCPQAGVNTWWSDGGIVSGGCRAFEGGVLLEEVGPHGEILGYKAWFWVPFSAISLPHDDDRQCSSGAMSHGKPLLSSVNSCHLKSYMPQMTHCTMEMVVWTFIVMEHKSQTKHVPDTPMRTWAGSCSKAGNDAFPVLVTFLAFGLAEARG